ncbi:MAG: hypothetical protein KJO91_13360, partial [Gammaproteobacteria bacterium]|nr:hypothetical protein [Gammaproteobacteria bacterium]
SVEILLYGKGVALLVEPGTIKNTKLQFNNSNKFIQTEINNLKHQGIKLIVCEKSPGVLNRNIETDFNNPEMHKLSPAARFQYLRSLGHLCIKP